MIRTGPLAGFNATRTGATGRAHELDLDLVESVLELHHETPGVLLHGELRCRRATRSMEAV